MRSLVAPCIAGLIVAAPLAPVGAHDEDAAARGARVYARACATCHGSSGRGDGPSAGALDPRPRDFTKGIYKFRSTPSGQPPTTDDLVRTIRAGIARTMMPAWGALLSDRSIRDVARYVETFSPATFERKIEPIQIPEAPEPTPAILAEGKSLYVLLSCWTCHGTRGRGDGKAAGGLTDDWGRKIVPFDFTIGRFKSGDTERDVYRTIYTGLNGTPMPAYGEAVLVTGASERMLARYREIYTEPEIAALIAYLETQPSREAMRKLSRAERTALAERRIWSVVRYVRSLRRQRGILHDLFVRDHEVTQ